MCLPTCVSVLVSVGVCVCVCVYLAPLATVQSTLTSNWSSSRCWHVAHALPLLLSLLRLMLRRPTSAALCRRPSAAPTRARAHCSPQNKFPRWKAFSIRHVCSHKMRQNCTRSTSHMQHPTTATTTTTSQSQSHRSRLRDVCSARANLSLRFLRLLQLHAKTTKRSCVLMNSHKQMKRMHTHTHTHSHSHMHMYSPIIYVQ